MAFWSPSGAAQTATAPARSITSSASSVSAGSLPSRRPQPERITPCRLAIRPTRLPRRRRERAAGDGGACAPREAQVMLEVVRGRQAIIEELLGVKEVRQIGAAVGRAALA